MKNDDDKRIVPASEIEDSGEITTNAGVEAALLEMEHAKHGLDGDGKPKAEAEEEPPADPPPEESVPEEAPEEKPPEEEPPVEEPPAEEPPPEEQPPAEEPPAEEPPPEEQPPEAAAEEPGEGEVVEISQEEATALGPKGQEILAKRIGAQVEKRNEAQAAQQEAEARRDELEAENARLQQELEQARQGAPAEPQFKSHEDVDAALLKNLDDQRRVAAAIQEGGYYEDGQLVLDEAQLVDLQTRLKQDELVNLPAARRALGTTSSSAPAEAPASEKPVQVRVVTRKSTTRPVSGAPKPPSERLAAKRRETDTEHAPAPGINMKKFADGGFNVDSAAAALLDLERSKSR